MSESIKHDHDSGSPLSQNQVESLVKAMETAQPCEPRPQLRETSAEPCDPQLLEAVGSLNCLIASALSRELSSTLRTSVDVNVNDVQQVTFRAYQHAADEHRWLSVLSPKTLQGDWCFDLSTQLCCLIVDRMLGGDPMPGETFTRPMTDIERRLVQRVVDRALESMLQVWQNVDDISWIVRHQDVVMPATAIAAGEDQVMVIRFAVSMCGDQTSMRFCLPVRTLDPLRSKLCGQDWNADDSGGARDHLSNNVASAGVDVAVTLAHSSIKSSDLLDLRVGDVIATEKNVDETLEMKIQNIPKFKTRAGSLGGKKAVQVQAAIEQQGAEQQGAEQQGAEQPRTEQPSTGQLRAGPMANDDLGPPLAPADNVADQ